MLNQEMVPLLNSGQRREIKTVFTRYRHILNTVKNMTVAKFKLAFTRYREMLFSKCVGLSSVFKICRQNICRLLVNYPPIPHIFHRFQNVPASCVRSINIAFAVSLSKIRPVRWYLCSKIRLTIHSNVVVPFKDPDQDRQLAAIAIDSEDDSKTADNQRLVGGQNSNPYRNIC